MPAMTYRVCMRRSCACLLEGCLDWGVACLHMGTGFYCSAEPDRCDPLPRCVPVSGINITPSLLQGTLPSLLEPDLLSPCFPWCMHCLHCLQSLRAQNDTLNQRLSAADSSNCALQSGLDKSWQSARAADRAAQDAKQQLIQAQQQILQLRQQLHHQGLSAAMPSMSAGYGLGSHSAGQSAGLSGGMAGHSWMDRAVDSYSLGAAMAPSSSALGLDSARPRFESSTMQGGLMYASQEWQGGARGLAASADAAPWSSAQQHGGFSSLSNSPSPTTAARAGPAPAEAGPSVSRSADSTPWFAGGGSRMASTQQISNHMRAPSPGEVAPSTGHGGAAAGGGFDLQQTARTAAPAAAAATPAAAPSSHMQLDQRLTQQVQQQQQHHGSGLAQASAADLGFSGSTVPLTREMMTVVEIMGATKQAEDQLLSLSKERDELEKELAKMPLGAGRTIKGRQRKQAVETRLDELGFEISRLRTQIKQLNGNIKR